MISLFGFFRKFIKGFGLLSFRRAQHISLAAFFVWIFRTRQSILERLVKSAFLRSLLKGLVCYHLEEHSILVDRRFLAWIVIGSRQSILEKFIIGFGLLSFRRPQHIGSAFFVWIFIDCRQSILERYV